MKRLLFLFVLCSCVSHAAEDPLAKARQLLTKGAYPQAIQLLRQSIVKAPSEVAAHTLLASALALQGDRSGAIEEAVEAARLAPDSAVVSNSLGAVLSRFAELKAARSAFARAVELDPDFAEAHVNYALALAGDGDTQGALAHLNSAIQINELKKADTSYPLYLRANAYSENQDFVKAIADLEKCTALRPEFFEAWSSLGSARKASGDEAGALRAFQKAAQIAPNDSAVQYRLGSQFLAIGDVHAAIAPLRRALNLNPSDRGTVYNLQRALSRDGNSGEAKRLQEQLKLLLKEKATLNASSLQAVELNNEGVRLEKTGDLKAALQKYRQALDLDPSHDGFRLNYGLALCRLSQWTEGIAELRDISERNPDNAQAARALYIATDQSAKAAKK